MKHLCVGAALAWSIAATVKAQEAPVRVALAGFRVDGRVRLDCEVDNAKS